LIMESYPNQAFPKLDLQVIESLARSTHNEWPQ
jgi:hypothetical protein